LPSTGLRTTDFQPHKIRHVTPTYDQSKRTSPCPCPEVHSCSHGWRLGRWCYDSRQLVHPSMFTTFYRLSLTRSKFIFLVLGTSGSKSNTGTTLRIHKRSIMSFGGVRKPNDLSTLYERVDPEIAQLAIAPLSLFKSSLRAIQFIDEVYLETYTVSK
jgi:hypothetical protein